MNRYSLNTVYKFSFCFIPESKLPFILCISALSINFLYWFVLSNQLGYLQQKYFNSIVFVSLQDCFPAWLNTIWHTHSTFYVFTRCLNWVNQHMRFLPKIWATLFLRLWTQKIDIPLVVPWSAEGHRIRNIVVITVNLPHIPVVK